MHLYVGQQPKNALIASDGDKRKDSLEQMQLSKLCKMRIMKTKNQGKFLSRVFRKITQEVKINCVILPPVFHEFKIKRFMLRKSCYRTYFLLCFLTTT